MINIKYILIVLITTFAPFPRWEAPQQPILQDLGVPKFSSTGLTRLSKPTSLRKTRALPSLPSTGRTRPSSIPLSPRLGRSRAFTFDRALPDLLQTVSTVTFGFVGELHTAPNIRDRDTLSDRHGLDGRVCTLRRISTTATLCPIDTAWTAELVHCAE
ncbi:hypothetical protein PUN28_002174 [Cardiocondyla obscurior]|uniref:Uncharacterized protein n=1 Tax=Cardiocondyla obscurior TaxID=286306 RepID=A0AAW2GST1_9HYME